MERFYSKIVGSPVRDDGVRPITTVKDLVVDPETGKVIAFVVDLRRNLIITPIDVAEWHDALKIHHDDAIIDGNEVLRVEEVQRSGIHIIDSRVETRSGVFVGKVHDFSVDGKMMTLHKLYVSKGFLGLVRYDNRIITADQIVEIVPGKVIVKDEMIAVREEAGEKIPLEDMAVG